MNSTLEIDALHCTGMDSIGEGERTNQSVGREIEGGR